MKLREFCEYIKTLKAYKRIQKEMVSYPKILEVKYNELLGHAKDVFADEYENIERWLDGKPCVFVHPNSRQIIEYKIGDDYEAFYYFLMFCKRINQHKGVSEEYVEYLAFLITRSNNPEWEES